MTHLFALKNIIETCKIIKPLYIFITGASGAGKTTLVENLAKALTIETVSINYFDHIGVPSTESIIPNYGSPEKWQEIMTYKWIKKLSVLSDKKVIILEGQFNPEFAVTALKSEAIDNYLLICIHATDEIRNERLIDLRQQPELVNADMSNWANILKNKTITLGGTVLYNQNNIQQLVDECAQVINTKLSQEIQQETNFTFRQVEPEDVPLLKEWFAEPHITKWWPVPKENEDFFNDFIPRMRSGNRPYIAFLDTVPFGYIQAYPVDTSASWLSSLPNSTLGTDQFIANHTCIGKGYGTRMLKDFILYLFSKNSLITTIIVDPDPQNIFAIKSYEKVGFKAVGKFAAPWGLVLLMRYDK